MGVRKTREKNGQGKNNKGRYKATKKKEGHFCSSSVVKASLKGCHSVPLWVCFN